MELEAGSHLDDGFLGIRWWGFVAVFLVEGVFLASTSGLEWLSFIRRIAVASLIFQVERLAVIPTLAPLLAFLEPNSLQLSEIVSGNA